MYPGKLLQAKLKGPEIQNFAELSNQLEIYIVIRRCPSIEVSTSINQSIKNQLINKSQPREYTANT